MIPVTSPIGTIISIDGQGNYFCRAKTRWIKKEPTAYLKERFKNYPPLRLCVRADKNTPGRQIKELMRIASEAGAVNVDILRHLPRLNQRDAAQTKKRTSRPWKCRWDP